MEGKITVEEGLAAGLVLTVEQGETVTEALKILTDHTESIRNSGRPGAVEASEAAAEMLLPVAHMFLHMVQCGMVLTREQVPTVEELMDLLEPDPWGQAEQRSDYMMSDEAYDVRGFSDDYGEE